MTGRRWRAAGAAAAVVALGVLAVLLLRPGAPGPGAPGPGAPPSPSATPGPWPAGVPADAGPLPVDGVPAGVSTGWELGELGADDLARELDLYADAGARWVRFDLNWGVVEAVEGTLDWSQPDRVVAAARARGLHVLATLTHTPGWARAVDDAHAPPADPGRFGEFVAAAAARYGTTVRAWEVWNEPNTATFWAPAPDPEAYARLLAAASAAVRSAAPAGGPGVTGPGGTGTGGAAAPPGAADGRLLVVAGALAPVATGAGDPPGTVGAATFLQRLYDAGAAGTFDAVSVHPYTWPALPGEPAGRAARAVQVHEVLAAHGDAAVPVWFTEFGAPTGTAPTAVDEAAQAEQVTAAFGWARGLGWAGPLFVYSGRDRGADPADPEANFGLVRRDFAPKPALEAFRRAAEGG